MTSDAAAQPIELEELKERVDIVEVVSAYVPTLKKAGRDWRGLCPFHTEKTPSFYVIPRQNRYYCFGCHASGDAVHFVQQLDSLSFVEAADRLARRIGRRFLGRGSREEKGLRERICDANSVAARHFADVLRSSERADGARHYVAGRGFSAETVDQWELGYSLPEWDALRTTLLGRGYTEDLLLRAGLLKERDSGTGSYDRFRGRVMFPIRSATAEVVAFGGRALDNEEPKYLNSPNTPTFDKSRTLYGLWRAADGIKAAGFALLVEGYTDVITCHQAAITNVVATLGTALTSDHLRVLRRYTARAVLAYDADSAGLGAMLRSAAELESSDLDVGVVVLAPGADPDSMVRNEGAEALRRLVGEAKPLYHFVLDSLLPDPGSAPDREAVRQVVERLAQLASPTRREHYVVYASDRICLGDRGRMAAMADALRREVRAALRRRGPGRTTDENPEDLRTVVTDRATADVPVDVRRREEAVIAALAQETVPPREVLGRTKAEHFVWAPNRELIARAAEFEARDVPLSDPSFLEGLSEEATRQWSIASVGTMHAAIDRESLLDCIERIGDGVRERRLNELQASVPGLAGKRERTDAEESLLREYMELRRYFAQRRGRGIDEAR